MDTWQAWAAATFSFIIAIITGDRMLEKRRTDNRNKFIYSKLDDLRDQQEKLSNRTTKLETEVVTEKEVRAIMTELMAPVNITMSDLKTNSDKITDQITEIRVCLAKGTKDEDSNI